MGYYILIYATGNFIYQNYRQSLEKIQENTVQLRALEAKLGTSATDYEADLLAERKYLSSLKTEPNSTIMAAEYMDLLSKRVEL